MKISENKTKQYQYWRQASINLQTQWARSHVQWYLRILTTDWEDSCISFFIWIFASYLNGLIENNFATKYCNSPVSAQQIVKLVLRAELRCLTSGAGLRDTSPQQFCLTVSLSVLKYLAWKMRYNVAVLLLLSRNKC